MNAINIIIAVVLALATTVLAAFFFLGTPEQKAQLLQQALWTGFGWRFYGFAVLGLIGTAIWWTVNFILVKTQLVKNVELIRTALILAAGPFIGSFIGTLVFCFL